MKVAGSASAVPASRLPHLQIQSIFPGNWKTIYSVARTLRQLRARPAIRDSVQSGVARRAFVHRRRGTARRFRQGRAHGRQQPPRGSHAHSARTGRRQLKFRRLDPFEGRCCDASNSGLEDIQREEAVGERLPLRVGRRYSQQLWIGLGQLPEHTRDSAITGAAQTSLLFSAFSVDAPPTITGRPIQHRWFERIEERPKCETRRHARCERFPGLTPIQAFKQPRLVRAGNKALRLRRAHRELH